MDRNTVLDALASCGVDTMEEQLLLCQRAKATQRPVLLVAGDEPGRPLDLLEGLGVPPLSAEGGALPYPVECVPGPRFELAAADSRGEIHHYYDAPSFLTHGGDDIVSLRVTVDAPLLETASVRFLTVSQEMLPSLPQLAGDCAGVALVLDSSAGAPEPAASGLCRWLKRTAGMGERICLILNHAEQGATNWMLESLLDIEPQATLSCDYDAPRGAEDSPQAVLAAAAGMLDGGAGDEEALSAQCLASARRKLDGHIAELEQAAADKTAAARWFRGSSRDFRAKMEMSKAALQVRLTPLQKEELYGDIQRLRDQLVQALPDMGAELAERHGRQAKDDMKNLAGEYVEALCNSYLKFVTRQIMDRDLMPQAEKAFREAEDEYRSLVARSPVPQGEWAGPSQGTELLKSVQLNLGDYQGGLSKLIGGLAFLAAAMVGAWLEINPYSTMSFARTAGRVVTDAVDRARSPRDYVAHYIRERLFPELDKLPEDLFNALDETILPQIGGDLANWFGDMVDERCALLERQAAALDDEAQALQAQRDGLAEDAARLARLEGQEDQA